MLSRRAPLVVLWMTTAACTAPVGSPPGLATVLTRGNAVIRLDVEGHDSTGISITRHPDARRLDHQVVHGCSRTDARRRGARRARSAARHVRRRLPDGRRTGRRHHGPTPAQPDVRAGRLHRRHRRDRTRRRPCRLRRSTATRGTRRDTRHSLRLLQRQPRSGRASGRGRRRTTVRRGHACAGVRPARHERQRHRDDAGRRLHLAVRLVDCTP